MGEVLSSELKYTTAEYTELNYKLAAEGGIMCDISDSFSNHFL